MPITKIEIAPTHAWGLWKIEEEESELCSMVAGFERVPERIRYPDKRLEFIAGRVLVRRLMEGLSLVFQGLSKDDFGKPLLNNSQYSVSLTHSFPYVAAIIDAEKTVGIDLEQINPKLLRIGPRVLHITELRDAGEDVVKRCVYWCCKETLMKIYGKRDVVFSENLLVEPFKLTDAGALIGRIIVEGKESIVKLQYYLIENFVLVHNS